MLFRFPLAKKLNNFKTLQINLGLSNFSDFSQKLPGNNRRDVYVNIDVTLQPSFDSHVIQNLHFL